MKNKKKLTAILTTVGALIFIVLLLLWQSEAFSVGDTDVNAPVLFLGNHVNVF